MMNGRLSQRYNADPNRRLRRLLLRPELADERAMWFGQLRQMAVHFEGNGRKLGLVVGGGLPAREGITLAENHSLTPIDWTL